VLLGGHLYNLKCKPPDRHLYGDDPGLDGPTGHDPDCPAATAAGYRDDTVGSPIWNIDLVGGPLWSLSADTIVYINVDAEYKFDRLPLSGNSQPTAIVASAGIVPNVSQQNSAGCVMGL